jgi:hypothetical protein
MGIKKRRRKVHVIFMLRKCLGAAFMSIMASRVFTLGNKSNSTLQFDLLLF